MKKYEGIGALANRYADTYNISKREARILVNNFVEVMKDSILDEDTDGIQLVDFITVEKVIRKPRLARNPRTKEEVMIPQRVGLKAYFGKTFAKIFNQ